MISDCAIRVTIAGNRSKRELAWETGCDLLLADIVWSPDSDMAGVLVGNNYCKGIYLTYDLQRYAVLPGNFMEAAHEQSLRRLFGPPKGRRERNETGWVGWALDSSQDAKLKGELFQAANP